MPMITVRLDRVFDVVHENGKDPHTLFSIEYGGRSHYGVRIPGLHAVRDGMIVSTFLEREGDWQSLLGWRDHSTGEIVCRSALFDFFPIVLAVFLVVFGIVFWDAAPIIAGLLAALAVGMLKWGIGALSRRADITQQLRDATGLPT